ncbi:hypothetical protein E2B39_06315, partial [Listeria monocytogenes]|nr:hypothetical protein [Listeria monocytogenes]
MVVWNYNRKKTREGCFDMLIEIKVSNFLSFKDEQKFSMVALNKYTELKDNLINIEDNFSVLKTASLFGANGSGKSNLFEAIRFIRRAVLSSFRDSDKKLLDSHFKLNPKYKELDSFFEIVFFSN